MSIPNERFNDGLHHWQLGVLQAFDEGLARFFALEWHRRARKTTLGLNLLIRECVRNPKSSYVYVAPTYTQARNIIWDDPNMLDAYLPDKAEMGCKMNEQKLHVKFANGSLLSVRGADKPDSLRGIDAAGVFFDEWALIKPEAWTEIFRPIIAQNAKRWAMFAFTPKGPNHATEMLDRALLSESEGWFGQTLRASESNLLPQVELDKARQEMPTSLYDQEFECARITDEERTLITSRMIEGLKAIALRLYPQTRRIISCDPATGGDECVCYVGENGEIIDELILHERDTMKIAGHLAILGSKYEIDDYIIDSIGLGKGIADRLTELGKNVQPFCSSEKAIDSDRFRNLRVEAWWYVMEQMEAHEVPYPVDSELRRQLSGVRYKVMDSSGRLQLDPKDATKKILGRSPDRADAYVMMQYGLQFVMPAERKNKRDAWAEDETPVDAMAM